MVTPELIAKLEALGGALVSAEPSPRGSFEVYTPLCADEPILWCTPLALADLIEEWEQQPQCRPRLRVWLGSCRD